MRMRLLSLFAAVALVGGFSTTAEAAFGTPVIGPITTQVWTPVGSPYVIIGPVVVPAGETLTIMPGVDVLFDVDVPFLVEGSLQTIGTETDSIRFLPGVAAEWGGIRISGGDSSTIAYVRISGGHAEGVFPDYFGGGIWLSDTARLGLYHSVIRGNRADFHGGGIYVCLYARLTVANSTIAENTAAQSGGGVYVSFYAVRSSVAILENCVIEGNDAGGWGGGIYVNPGVVRLTKCVIIGNSATGRGGGAHFGGYSEVSPKLCLIAGNTASFGGGVDLENVVIPIADCTVAANTATNASSAGVHAISSSATATSSILWNNAPKSAILTESTLTTRYSDIQGGWPGTGNIDADPLFADAANGDYHLTFGSPAIDAGDPSSPLDLDGTRADIGAFPFYQETPPAQNALALPTLTVSPGESFDVPITGILTDAYAADFYFVTDTSVIEGREPLVSYTAWGAGASIETSFLNDTVIVSVASTTPITTIWNDDVLAWLSFRAKTNLPVGQLNVAPLAWDPFNTNVNEGPLVLLTSGAITVNRPPVFAPRADTTIAEGESLWFAADATDDDGEEFGIEVIQAPQGALPDGRFFSWQPTFDDAGTYEVIFAASDMYSVVFDTVVITVNNTNRAPQWGEISSKFVNEAETLTFGTVATDPDETPLESEVIELPPGAVYDPQTGEFSWTPGYDQAGDWQFQVVASDGQAADTLRVPITVSNVNRAPYWDPPTPDQTIGEEETLSFHVYATDLDGPVSDYQAWFLPTGAEFNVFEKRFQWTPAFGDSGTYEVVFYAADTVVGVTDTVEIHVVRTNNAPVMVARADTSVKATKTLAFTVVATDADEHPLTYEMIVAPEGASFDPETQVFSWTPTYDDVGLGYWTTMFSVTDGRETAYDTVDVNVWARWGDVNDNDTLTALDASWILQNVVRTRPIIDVRLADVTVNGKVTSFDASYVLRKVVDPESVMPVEMQGQQAKPAISGATFGPRTFVWTRDGAGWVLALDDATGVLAGDLVIDLPDDVATTVSGGAYLAYAQDGTTLRIAFARLDDGTPIAIRLDRADLAEPPAIALVELNEGAVPIAAIVRPAEFSLLQNAPNPFNPSTTIRFGLPAASRVDLTIYDVNGRLVRSLLSADVTAGAHEIVWDGRDSGGKQVASGVYVYRLASEHGTLVRRMTLAR